jgi:RNA polymerase-associated protein LEO1
MSGTESPAANGYGHDSQPPTPGGSPLNELDGDDADLFGDGDDNEQDDSLNRKLDDAELDSGDDEGRDDRVARSVEHYLDELPIKQEVVSKSVIARVNALESDELYVVNMPRFLGREQKDFDYHTYEPPTRPHDQTDPTDKFSAYSTATTSLMWRRDPQDPTQLQSNSRIIRWSDGSLTLQIASRPRDQYRISTKAYRQGFNATKAQKTQAQQNYDPAKDAQVYLGAVHNSAEMIQILAPVDAQMKILPTGDLSDASIQKLHHSLIASQATHDPLASLKTLKEDPEIARKAAELFEKDRLKSLRKRENAEDKLLTKRDRVLGRAGLGGRAGGLSAAGLEADEDGMPRSSAFRSKPKRRGNRRGDIYSDDEDEDLPRGRTREDEYDLDDGFMAGSDEEIETYEDDSADDPDVDDLEIEGRNTVVKEKTRGGVRSVSPLKRAAETDAPGEDDGVGGGSPGQARKKRTRIIDDDDDDV